VLRICRVALGAIMASLLVWLVVAGASHQALGSPSRSTTTTSASPSRQLKPVTLASVLQLVDASVNVKKLNARLLNELPRVGRDTADGTEGLPLNCIAATTGCVFGDLRSPVTVVLLGDSHARMWLPAILPSATSDHLRIVVLGRDGCPVVSFTVSHRFGGCGPVVANALKVIAVLHPAGVIVSDRTSYGGVTTSAWQSAFATALTRLKRSGAHVAVIGDIPALNFGGVANVLSCLNIHPDSVQECSVPNPNEADPGHENAERIATREAHATYINPAPWLCTPHSCSPIIGDNIVYWDAFHITAKYSTFLSGVMGGALHSFFASVRHAS
jgi:hypothetical protein